MLKAVTKQAMESPVHLSKGRKSQALDAEVYKNCMDFLYAHNFVAINNLQIIKSQD